MQKDSIKKYALRALKHLLKMTLLMVAIYLVLMATGTLGITTEELLGYKGAILLVALVAISLTYPNYGFVCNTSRANLVANRKQIIEAFGMSNYVLSQEREGEMIFRAKSPIKRLIHLGDDVIRVSATPAGVTIEGLRKEVTTIEFRLSNRIELINE